MRDDRTRNLLAAATAPVRRLPERRVVVLGAALCLFVAIFVVRQLTSATGDAISLLYVIPVALVALELGMLAGAVAAVVAVAAVAVWMATGQSGVDALALAIRGLIFLAVGLIAGRFSDRMRTSGRREEHLLRSGLDLARLGDSGSVASLLAEHVSAGVEVASVRVELSGSPAVSIGEPAGESLWLPIVSRGTRLGSLQASAGSGRRFSPEDRLMLQTLAMQAAVAGENQRLLAVERDQAALQTELHRIRRRLGDQLRNAGRVLERHEQERRGIARQLHEEAAQAMAAALLTVGMLERGVQDELTQAQLADVRGQVKSSIAELRRLAGSLRPAVLDEMGLASALSRISELEADRGGRSVTFGLDGLPERLDREAETSTYRVIEESLQALSSATAVQVSLGTQQAGTPQERIRIVLVASVAQDDPLDGADGGRQLDAALWATRARVELIGGSVHVGWLQEGAVRIVAEFPLGG